MRSARFRLNRLRLKTRTAWYKAVILSYRMVSLLVGSRRKKRRRDRLRDMWRH